MLEKLIADLAKRKVTVEIVTKTPLPGKQREPYHTAKISMAANAYDRPNPVNFDFTATGETHDELAADIQAKLPLVEGIIAGAERERERRAAEQAKYWSRPIGTREEAKPTATERLDKAIETAPAKAEPVKADTKLADGFTEEQHAAAIARRRASIGRTAARGVGHTALMLQSLPFYYCHIVVASHEMAMEIRSRLDAQKRDRGTYRIVVVRDEADAQALYGVREPVFIDNSIYMGGNRPSDAVVREVFRLAIGGNFDCQARLVEAGWSSVHSGKNQDPITSDILLNKAENENYRAGYVDGRREGAKAASAA